MSRFNTLTLLICAVAPLTVQGQRGGGRNAPPFDGARGPLALELATGEPVSFYLEISREIDLTDAQRQKLIEIRRKLRALNAGFVQQMDSLRALAGIELGERERISARDREALRRFQEWSRPVVDSIRMNNDVASAEARGLLLVEQRDRADSIAAAVPSRRRGREPNRPNGGRGT